MKKQALILGLTAVLFAFPFHWAFALLVGFVGLSFIHWLVIPTALVAAWLTAAKLAPRVEGEDVPSVWFIVLLRITAGFYLLVQLIWTLGAIVNLGGFMWRVYLYSDWALIISALLTIRFVKRRLMLFVGLTAFALQFKAASLLALLSIPGWVVFVVTLIIAVLVARQFCVGEDSAADRVADPLHLWFFGAAGALAAFTMRDSLLFSRNMEMLIWLAFLVSFVVLARSVCGADLREGSSAERPTPGRIFVIFVSLLVVVSTIFQVQDFIERKLPYSPEGGLRLWVPLGVAAVVAIAIMFVLELGSRVPATGRGYKLLFWGVIFCGLVALSSVGLFSSIASADQMGQIIGVVIWLALFAAPLMAAAQILVSIGLLRMLLKARPS